jgi:hypothetical protein
VHRVLTRFGLARLRHLDRATGRVIRRYERERPGELVHVDIKKLGNIPDGGGHRVLGRQAGRKTRTGVGYQYIHTAVDDHSRLAYSEILTARAANTSVSAAGPVPGLCGSRTAFSDARSAGGRGSGRRHGAGPATDPAREMARQEGLWELVARTRIRGRAHDRSTRTASAYANGPTQIDARYQLPRYQRLESPPPSPPPPQAEREMPQAVLIRDDLRAAGVGAVTGQADGRRSVRPPVVLGTAVGTESHEGSRAWRSPVRRRVPELRVRRWATPVIAVWPQQVRLRAEA